MHILIVTAHPDPASFTHAAVARFIARIETVPGTTHEVVDLIAEGFDPRFTSADDDAFDGRTAVGTEVVTQQQRLDRADDRGRSTVIRDDRRAESGLSASRYIGRKVAIPLSTRHCHCGPTSICPKADMEQEHVPAPQRVSARSASMTSMKAYWNNCGDGPSSGEAHKVDLREVSLIWSDEVSGVEGNFLGLIDDEGRTVQFYFVAGIPDDVDDASHLRIVLMDFPLPEQRKSYEKYVTIGEVQPLIENVFKDGADHRRFDGLTVASW